MAETMAQPVGFGGRVLRAGEPDYDEARTIFNAMIDKRPGLIAQCESAADVAAAIRYGVNQGLEIAVRGGGHGVAGTGLSNGGLVVDLRRLNGVQVDPEAGLARVEGGALWADLDRACQPYGLATTGGRVSTTGIAGLTLGGGSGWLERKWGLACDNLVAVELVTADGRTVTASEDENPELFWALHGGGGNFGVATSLTFRVRPLPAVTLMLLLWPAESGPEIVRAYRDLITSGAPDDLGGGAIYLTGPPEEFVPEHLHGRLLVAAGAIYAGHEAEAREVFRPMLELAPEGAMIAELPYAGLQSALDDPPGFRNYWSAEHLSAFPDEAVQAFCDRSADMPAPSPSQQIAVPWGGAVARDADRWPLPHRSADWVIHPFGLWADPAEDGQGIGWARALCEDVRPWATGAVYLNFIGDEGRDRVVAGFGKDNYERLAVIKAEYDPGNVFRLNQNIRPAGNGSK
ncbi:FAD/FMN-containing dehydrogenase [Kribbella amoyensis]|uniref:FAD/FMN-containing dehydrogenase n=1 Tax=Kribbella amoyensis TaxID=996641 RepID=A0A561B3L3_9ACTN|nr:FAD-binding oxidoreductase [Kribbella amoyensis]TWD73455.1 FAD/FMN-containing dehydrogenase [Kribbella amoyensis]